MAPLGIWLVAFTFALALALPAAAEIAPRRRAFAPGTGSTCSSFCAQRWYAQPANARSCATACFSRSLSGTNYFLGSLNGAELDCNEQLVSPTGEQQPCKGGGKGFPERDPNRRRF